MFALRFAENLPYIVVLVDEFADLMMTQVRAKVERADRAPGAARREDSLTGDAASVGRCDTGFE